MYLCLLCPIDQILITFFIHFSLPTLISMPFGSAPFKHFFFSLTVILPEAALCKCFGREKKNCFERKGEATADCYARRGGLGRITITGRANFHGG